MKVIILNNPYSGVDWASTPRVKACSHEHVFNADLVARMYDRGIRFFAHVHYIPAVPRYPLSNHQGSYEDWCFYDTNWSNATKTYSSAASARKSTPAEYPGQGGVVTTNYRQNGLIVAYKDDNNVQHWTQLTRDLNAGETWNHCCEDETAWVERIDESDVDAHLMKHIRSFAGSVPTFKSKSSVSEYTGMSAISFEGDGLTHNTDDFPQIPNAEHTRFSTGIDGNHFNVMGSTASEAAWSTGSTNAWRIAHPMYNIDDIATVFPASSSFYDGKLFGTVNHCTNIAIFRNCQDKYPWFKGYEVFNNGSSRSRNETFLSNFHTYLNEGRTVYCLAVTDWQQDFRGMSDVDGGTNVLYLPSDYESMSVANKSKAGMDAYISGSFVASRFGSKHVVDFSIDENEGTAHFEVSGIAKDISLIFNGNYTTLHDVSEIEMTIPRGTTNITAEAWFADSNQLFYKSDDKLADDSDFLITQAIIIETPKKDSSMNKKMIMFALDN